MTHRSSMVFDLHIGIDYSGAQAANRRLAGLQVYASRGDEPERISTPAAPESNSWNWTRQEIASWLIEQARSGQRFIVGIDHAFSFPLTYFERYSLTGWDQFLEDFVEHWPTHKPNTYVDFIRDGVIPENKGLPPARIGDPTELRLTDRWTSSAKSVFLFDVQGSVAKSTHAGIPWLWHIRREVGHLVHFWPFDGWQIPPEKSLIVEVYPSIFRNRYPREARTGHQQDAYATARWLHETDRRGFLEPYLDPPLTEAECRKAQLEGWILGIL